MNICFCSCCFSYAIINEKTRNMNGKTMLTVLVVGLCLIVQNSCELVPATKVFILPIEPAMFNWSVKLDDDYSYRASLLNSPDLPKWIEYVHSKKHKAGFLYGVPPNDPRELEIEIIGLNHRTYETRRRVIHLKVDEKLNPATHQVHMKIDNLNVEDLFDLYRMSRLLNIFKYKLWKESFFDLYFTFLTSAVSLGARLPLRPTEGEGVVVRLGSVSGFSNTLIELQEEVKPLWKLQSCPRDFKRTTVERIFRDEGFILDWCNFRLLHETPNPVKTMGNLYKEPLEQKMFNEPTWSRPTKNELVCRNYTGDFLFSILIPFFLMIVCAMLLSAIVGFQHEKLFKRKETKPQISGLEFLRDPLRHSGALYPGLNNTSRSRTSSPRTMPRTDFASGATRPTPPPYNGHVRATVVDF